MTPRKVNHTLLFVCLNMCGSSLAHSQSQPTFFQAEHFEPQPTPKYNTLNIARSETLEHLALSYGIITHYANNPLPGVIDHQVRGELAMSFGLFDLLEFGLVVPLVLFESGTTPSRAESLSVADARWVPKVRLLDAAEYGGFGAALLLPVYLPLGEPSRFHSDGSIRAEPRFAADWQSPGGVRISVNLGYQLSLVSDGLFRWGLGLEVPITSSRRLVWLGSAFGNLTAREDSGGRASDIPLHRGQPVEALGGLRYLFSDTLEASASAGIGLTDGMGAADFRCVLSLSMSTDIALDTQE